ncbi:hypothetical protein FSP39_020262 [Pinctada imbricata]|uniref:DOMON domain-containing protein n=1 Tax=Pinctada imbricata TaxID=66713 RepID=A0AA88XN82_PINIB|nr:hypothetical protein FSP39_020262 [Pinctada imbricata]
MLASVFLFAVISTVTCVPAAPGTGPTPTESFPFHTSLDTNGNYLLYWKFNATHITFETHVRTKGYVGFGFSTNGKMYPADVVIGWVKDGVTHFKDRHAVGHYLPVVDASQDWILLHGEENSFGTVLKMVRKFDTCDQDDMKITNDTIRTIWSYHNDDPADDNSIFYHGSTNRGSKSLMLTSYQSKKPTMPNDVITMDFLNDNFEPIVQKGHESLVHHVLLYKCPQVDLSQIGFEYVCSGGTKGRGVNPCGNIWIAWATGGESFYFPDEVGMPLGEPGDNDVLILETHYNNPGRRSDFIDSSGMRITYTPTLRPHDAGLLTAGMMVHPFQIIPPQIKDFRSTAFCTADCLRKGLSKFHSGVEVFAVLQHAHLLGRGIRTRLYRNGKELEPLAYDEHYDFDYQEYRFLNNRRTLQSGDSIVVECKYDSTGRVNKTIVSYGYDYVPRPKVEYQEPSSCPKNKQPTQQTLSVSHALDPNASPKPTEAFPYMEQLDHDGKYILFWKFNSTHITFEVHVRTHGYVGFGLSPNGNMFPADVVIGWVKNGQAYFKDRHTTAYSSPLIDSSQDWFLLHAEENDFGTVLKMVRKLDTCDHHDLKITFEPVLQKGNEGIVHHIVVYKCPNIDRQYVGVTYHCQSPPHHSLHPCSIFYLAWAAGGEVFNFPKDVGLPFADPKDPSMFIIETHYNNPAKQSGYVDNSGLRLYLTPTLQKHEAGILTSGLSVNKYHIVPPYEQAFISSGFCTEDCLNKGGLGTSEEMCLSFIYYYPAMIVDTCQVTPMYDDIPIPHNKVLPMARTYNWTDPQHREDFREYLANTKYHAKSSVCLFAVISIVTCVPTTQGTSPTPTENFPFHTSLDTNGNYMLYWKFNATHITFETHVRTKGYVGFGFSTNGKMYPADIVIGWVKDGVTHFKDRHSVGHSLPVVDASQDWFLLHGEENSFGTVLKMVRKFDTCDQNDMKITNDTIRTIWSYHTNDPADDISIPYHGPTNRGSKSLMLTSYQAKKPSMPNDVITMDFLNDNFEPIVQKGHESLVHHVLLYKCPEVDLSQIGFEYVCGAKGRVDRCGNIWIAWATGGESFYFPDEVGMPLGEPGDNDVLILETHYNNPGRRSDFIDSSGMRITYTPTLRPHDAGLLTAGMMVNSWQIIPPQIKDFRSSAFCTAGCLSKGLSKFHSGVEVFAVLQHAHLLGSGIRTRLYRNGKELEPLAYDEHYDFDYQEYRFLNNRRSLQSGDSIVVECKYDSTGRVNVTRSKYHFKGGLSTRDEMCLSFLYYYPRMDVEMCESLPIYDNINGDYRKVAQILDSMDFHNKTVVNMYLDKLNSSRYTALCRGRNLRPNESHGNHYVPHPNILYKEPSSCPKTKQQTQQTMGVNDTLDPNALPKPTEVFPYTEQLDHDGKYILFWKFNSTHITFEVHVRTHGYVGFGLSPNGNMFPADVVIGWVKNGQAYFKDRHTTAYSSPLIDSSQDWFLLHAKENDFGTVLKMVRKLDTCDHHDLKITDSTIRIIFSYHPDDPQSETGLPYHGNTRRGAHSLMLLNRLEEFPLPSDVITQEFLNDDFHLPPVDTYYHCKVYDMHTLGKKHHLVRFEPVLQKGNEGIVHHIVVYKCANIDRKYVGVTYHCQRPPHDSLHPCSIFYLAWAVGGEVFNFPRDVGLPFADPKDPSMFIIETHYNNPAKTPGYVDNSGLRLYLTPTLQKHEAGILTSGLSVNKYHIVPPYEQTFISSGFCMEDCLNKGLSSMPDGVKVFAVLQHAHLLARGITTRLIRKGVEQEPLAEDPHYDFNFQDFRHIRNNRTIKSGDTIVVECTYDSTKKTAPTYGGLGTSEEMCLSFIYYYPSMIVDTCQVTPIYDDIPIPHNQVLPMSRTYNWTDPQHREDFREYLANTKYHAKCAGMFMSPQVTYETVQIPTSRYHYLPPKSQCDGY